MISVRWGLLLSLVFGLETVSGAKILAWFAMPAPSHHIAFQPVLRELANRGHTVDFYSAIPMKSPPKTLRNFQLPNALENPNPEGKMDMRALGTLPSPFISFVMYKLGEMTTKKIAESKVFQDLMNSNEKYDLVIGEFLFINEDASALMHKFKVPGVCMFPIGDSAWVNELSGLPDNPAYMIDFKSLYTDEMGFFQRLHNVYTTTVTNLVCYLYTTFPQQWLMDSVYKYPGWESRPRLPLLASDFALILTHSHHSVGYSFPKAPHVKEVAGLNIQPNKPLPQDLQTFMDSATDGVIYFSLGSVVDMSELMKDGTFETIHSLFKGLKQKVLWKFKDENMIPRVTTPNIKFSTWFPQQDILAHKNCKLFITHGGLMSTIEAINYGVPLIGIAVFGDQPKNLVRMRTAGYGIELDYENITQASISWAINEALGNPSYKKEILRRQALFKDRQMPPIEEATYWVEYVLRHGKVLQPASAQMPFYKLYLLDLIGFLAVCLLLILWVLKIVLRVLSGLFGRKSKKSVPASKKKQ